MLEMFSWCIFCSHLWTKPCQSFCIFSTGVLLCFFYLSQFFSLFSELCPISLLLYLKLDLVFHIGTCYNSSLPRLSYSLLLLSHCGVYSSFYFIFFIAAALLIKLWLFFPSPFLWGCCLTTSCLAFIYVV